MKVRLVGLSVLLALMMTATTHAGRLFATANVSSLGIIEIDPLTGDVINVIKPFNDSPRHAVWDGLAFDGSNLWFLGLDKNTIFKIDPDSGATIDSYALTPPNDFRSGLAYLNGLLYTLDWDGSTQDITVIDPTDGTIVGSLDIDGVNGLAPNALAILDRGFTAIADPDKLLVATGVDGSDTHEFLVIDPTTGVITDRLEHAQDWDVRGAASVDGEIYMSTGKSAGIFVYDRSGNHLRSITVPGATNGIKALAGSGNLAVPEPATVCLLLSGLLMFAGRSWWRRLRR
jgi:PEP-CTERM motif